MPNQRGVGGNAGLNAYDKRMLASIVHQVWRHSQIFVSLAVERGVGEAFYTLLELAEWAVSQRRRLSPRSPQRPAMVTTAGMKIGRILLEDIDTFVHAIGENLAKLQFSNLSPEEVEEEALTIIEGFLAWSTMMASQLGISHHLRPQTLWFER